MSNYVYIKTNVALIWSKFETTLKAQELYTVGFTWPDGSWEAESDWPSAALSLARLHALASASESHQRLVNALEAIEEAPSRHRRPIGPVA
jgi:hypothetical protein